MQVSSILPPHASELHPAPPCRCAPSCPPMQVRSTRHGRSVKPKAYKYNPTPLITEILPSGGQADGGDHITIRGRHLGKGDVKRVYVGSRQAHVLHSSADGREILIQTRRAPHAC